ncbi:hypothetical protein ACS0TY_030919 [Phlomoides rotata]
MPEGRDRLSRQDETIAAWSLGRGGSIPFVLDDGDEAGQGITSFRWRDAPMVGSTGLAAGRGALESPRIRRFSPIIGPENLSPVAGRGRGRGSPLPTWYPRRPLNDITAVMRAIERRRERQRDGDGLETQGRIHHDRDHLEHNVPPISPRPTLLTRCCSPSSSKSPKILLDNITHKNDEDSSLSPEKKLLIIIDSVEKVVMEELRKMQRTPSAKKAEREKRVRTLMSMR